MEIELARVKRQQEIAEAVVIPSGPVYDVISLVEKCAKDIKKLLKGLKMSSKGAAKQVRWRRAGLREPPRGRQGHHRKKALKRA